MAKKDTLQNTFNKYFGGPTGLRDPITFLSKEDYAELRRQLAAEAAERNRALDEYIAHEYGYYPEEG